MDAVIDHIESRDVEWRGMGWNAEAKSLALADGIVWHTVMLADDITIQHELPSVWSGHLGRAHPISQESPVIIVLHKADLVALLLLRNGEAVLLCYHSSLGLRVILERKHRPVEMLLADRPERVGLILHAIGGLRDDHAWRSPRRASSL